MIYDHVWYWRTRPLCSWTCTHAHRKGQRCRVLARGSMNSILVEFEDGYRVVTSRYAVRRAKETRCSNGTTRW